MKTLALIIALLGQIPEETPSAKVLHQELDRLYEQAERGVPEGQRPIDKEPLPPGFHQLDPVHHDTPGLCEDAPHLWFGRGLEKGDLMVVMPACSGDYGVYKEGNCNVAGGPVRAKVWRIKDDAGIKPPDASLPTYKVVTLLGGFHRGYQIQRIHRGPNTWTHRTPTGDENYLGVQADGRIYTVRYKDLKRLDHPDKCMAIYRGVKESMSRLSRRRPDYVYEVKRIEMNARSQYEVNALDYPLLIKIGDFNRWDRTTIKEPEKPVGPSRKKSVLGG